MLTFLAFARNSGVEVLAYSDRATATLALAERRMRITKVTLRPKITLASGADPEKARRLVDRAHAGCFIANSVACEVVLEPEIAPGS
jgi:organic hydroperoxide reductase OsmC/OhrA